MPPELWTVVLQNYGNSIEGFVHLWTQCRQVSKQFKADVENTFSKQHLLSITIDFEQITKNFSYPFAFTHKPLETKYIELSQDRKTALFGVHGAEKKEIVAQWKTSSMGTPSFREIHLYELGGVVYLPRFALREADNVILKIDWKELVDSILGRGKAAIHHNGSESKYPSPSETEYIEQRPLH